MKRFLLVLLAIPLSASLARAYAGTSPSVPVPPPPPPPTAQEWIPAGNDRNDLQAAVAQAIQRANFRNCVVGTDPGTRRPVLEKDAKSAGWFIDYPIYRVFRSGTDQPAVRLLNGLEPADNKSETASSDYTEMIVTLAPDETVTSVRVREVHWQKSPVFQGVLHPIKTIAVSETQTDGIYCSTSAN